MKKRLVTIGDSITKGTYFEKNDAVFVANPNFSTIVKESLGFEELINYGVDGVCISSQTQQCPERAICKTVDTMEMGNLVLVAAGTNDYATNVPLGNIEDCTDVSFFGALYVLFKKLNNKQAKVYIVTPIPRAQDGQNLLGYSLDDYRTAIMMRAKEFHFHIIDGKKVPINPKESLEREKYMFDGLHPNTSGHKIYAEYILKGIQDCENGNISI